MRTGHLTLLIVGIMFCYPQTRILGQIDSVIDGSIDYLIAKQYSVTDPAQHTYAGEWPSYMLLEDRFILLGGAGKKHEDSNLFTLGSVHNILCRIYFQDTTRTEVKEMILNAYPRLSAFKNKGRYNFWNLLPPQIQLNKFRPLDQQLLVRRPTHFPLKNRFIHKAANVTEDADDTAIGYLAEYYHEKMVSGTANEAKKNQIVGLFEQYKDSGRKNRHWYNHVHGFEHNTGAYLTWHGKEYHFRKWNPFKELLHNLIHFVPISKNYPFLEKPYLPYGSNDVDAVVNSNILVLFAHLETRGLGCSKSIEYLEKKVFNEKYDIAASYYPNRYATAYSISQAYAAGIFELERSMHRMNEYISAQQEPDGSWSSKKSINNGDRLQSTVYAVSCLLNNSPQERENYRCEIEEGVDFILKNGIWENDRVHWEGGVVFSGGSIIRNALFWKSDALTTAMIAELLINYRSAFLSHDPLELSIQQ